MVIGIAIYKYSMIISLNSEVMASYSGGASEHVRTSISLILSVSADLNKWRDAT